MGEEYEGEVEVEDDSQPIAEGLPTSDQWWVLSDAVHLDGFRARVVCNTGSPRARAAHECELRGWLEMVGSPGEDAAMWRPTPLGVAGVEPRRFEDTHPMQSIGDDRVWPTARQACPLRRWG